MKYRLESRNIWECGQRVDAAGRPHQEDSIFPSYGQQKDSDRLFILCDGMGGHEAGEVASATVCEAMSKYVCEHTGGDVGAFSDDVLSGALAAAFDALDAVDPDAVNQQKKKGTTMTFLMLHDRGATIAHIGDSRVYHIRPGKDGDSTRILFQTEDHSLVNDLIKIGELTPEEARHSRQKNVITRAMQPAMERRPKADIHHTYDIQPGDYFYMCSDGMLEQMDDSQLRLHFSDEMGDIDSKARNLTLATQENSDNHTAHIIHILEVTDVQAPPEEESSQQPAGRKPPIMAVVEGEEVNNDIPMAKVKDEAADSVPEQLSSPEAPPSSPEASPASPERRCCLPRLDRKHMLLLLVLLLAIAVLVAYGCLFGCKQPQQAAAATDEDTRFP